MHVEICPEHTEVYEKETQTDALESEDPDGDTSMDGIGDTTKPEPLTNCTRTRTLFNPENSPETQKALHLSKDPIEDPV